MQVVLNTPANLQGQLADRLFDPGLTGVARGAGPSGPLGATITLPIAFQRQAIGMGFTVSSYIYG